MTKAPKFKSKRYVKSIKEAMNVMLANKSNIHLTIAQIIAGYSHQTLVKQGNTLMNEKLEFFVVEKILSSHFLKGFFCNGRIIHTGEFYWYEPNLYSRSESVVKKIISPFSQVPHVKVRSRRYYLKQIKKHESMQNFATLAY